MTNAGINYESFTKAEAARCWHFSGDGVTIAVSSHRAFSESDGPRHVYRAWYNCADLGSGTTYGATFDEAVAVAVAQISAQ